MTINGGNIDITASDDGLNSGGTGANQNGGFGGGTNMQGGQQDNRGKIGRQNSDGQDGNQMTPPNMQQAEGNEQDSEHHIQINGGNIKIVADADGIDSNGSLFINGGTITVDAQATGAESAFDTDGAFIVNGGTIIGVSGSGMDESPNSYSDQNVILAYTTSQISAGDEVKITDSNGKTIAEYTAVKGGSKIVYSSDKLKTGEMYTVYASGEEVGSAEIESSITKIGTKSNSGFGGGHRQKTTDDTTDTGATN